MLRAFLGFPVDLPAIPEPFEQLRNAARRNLMAHLTQRRRELGVALGYPQQRSHRVADRRRLQKLSQVLKQRRVLLDQCSSAASRAPHPVRCSRKIEFLQPSPNRASSDPRRPRNRADPADPRRPRLRRCKKASPPLIEPGAESLVTDANRAFVYHPPRIRIILRAGNPLTDSIISPRRLSVGIGYFVLGMGAPELAREIVYSGRRAGGRCGLTELVGEHGSPFRDPPVERSASGKATPSPQKRACVRARFRGR